VGGTGSGLEEGGIDIGQVLDLENAANGRSNERSKSAIHRHTTSLEVLAEEFFTTATIKTRTTQF
jgi:hypothetical protein